MKIYEVIFDDKNKIQSTFFSSKSKADKFITSNITEIHILDRQTHIIQKSKEKILKFLNRDNGLG